MPKYIFSENTHEFYDISFDIVYKSNELYKQLPNLYKTNAGMDQFYLLSEEINTLCDKYDNSEDQLLKDYPIEKIDNLHIIAFGLMKDNHITN